MILLVKLLFLSHLKQEYDEKISLKLNFCFGSI